MLLMYYKYNLLMFKNISRLTRNYNSTHEQWIKLQIIFTYLIINYIHGWKKFLSFLIDFIRVSGKTQ